MEVSTGASRGELLEWINSSLKMNLHKIEETASGAVACQIIDMIHPDTVPLQRVNFAAKDTYEFSKNYKILQAAFLKNKIEKNIDVERLMKARPQDNLEFMQWLKKYYDHHLPQGDYDAENRRASSKGGKEITVTSVLRSRTIETSNSRTNRTSSSSPITSIPSSPPSKRPKLATHCPMKTFTRKNADYENEIDDLKHSLQEKDGIIQKQMLMIGNLESERDYYNQKLVSIEEYLQNVNKEENRTVDSVYQGIQSILYQEVELNRTGEADNTGSEVLDNDKVKSIETTAVETY